MRDPRFRSAMPYDSVMSGFDEDIATLSDDALILLFSKGDEDAAAILVGRHLTRVLRFASRFLGNESEAEDVAQDAMMRLWKAAANWQPGRAKLSTWLYTVTRNLCIDRLRQTRASIEGEELLSDAPSVQEKMEAETRRAALHLALSELPEQQRQAVILRHIEGLSNSEISQIMGVSIEAVESSTARGKRNLKALLDKQKLYIGFEE